MRAIESAEQAIDALLVVRRLADDRVRNLAGDVGDRVLHAFAAEALGVFVTTLVGFEAARAGAGGDDSASGGAAFEADLDLDGRIAAGVEHFERLNG